MSSKLVSEGPPGTLTCDGEAVGFVLPPVPCPFCGLKVSLIPSGSSPGVAHETPSCDTFQRLEAEDFVHACLVELNRRAALS